MAHNSQRVLDINVRSHFSDLNGSASGSGRMGTFAGGGTVHGPGTSKSDSVPVMASVGEEIIQEPYASLNRKLLKEINAGRVTPQSFYAAGGTVGYAEPAYARPQYAQPAPYYAGGGTPPLPDIYVQNPFTGEYLLSQVSDVAGRVTNQRFEQELGRTHAALSGKKN